MSSKIRPYKSEYGHLEIDGAIIEKWNENRIPLPKGAGAEFIAPTNLIAKLYKPLYFNWNWEAGGRPFWADPEELVYGENWLKPLSPSYPYYGGAWTGSISHFPYSKELLKINEWLNRYGWSIPADWRPIIKAINAEIEYPKGTILTRASMREGIFRSLEDRYKFSRSGSVLHGWLLYRGWLGSYWSTLEHSKFDTCCLTITNERGTVTVDAQDAQRRSIAMAVRCVSTM
ncbi:hypothetical protein IKF34_00060 [Candidatus Saccharibacteria bacterium]|nr:hypothetical protein [Candidatus Saccharibacteria bacterium]